MSKCTSAARVRMSAHRAGQCFSMLTSLTQECSPVCGLIYQRTTWRLGTQGMLGPCASRITALHPVEEKKFLLFQSQSAVEVLGSHTQARTRKHAHTRRHAGTYRITFQLLRFSFDQLVIYFCAVVYSSRGLFFPLCCSPNCSFMQWLNRYSNRMVCS